MEKASVPGILHWYTDSLSVAERALAAGLYFSVNPSMTRSKGGQRLLQLLPTDASGETGSPEAYVLSLEVRRRLGDGYDDDPVLSRFTENRVRVSVVQMTMRESQIGHAVLLFRAREAPAVPSSPP
jgi:hypothetical protein